MDTLCFDLTKKVGEFKPMHAVNNGPIGSSRGRGNMDNYKAANIPFARTHDAAFCASYGGEFSVDISAIFPNFDADEKDPASYEFECTDKYMQDIFEGGAEPFFRLGQKIEHQVKKYHIHPPKDFYKWAVVCEHIIRHYTQGWADGFNYNISYWEIWNEPELNIDESKENYLDIALPDSPTWTGTQREFFDFFEIVSKHLKDCFPHLKIGGPAAAGYEVWIEDFLKEMQKRAVPMDFFSWHLYRREVERVKSRCEKTRESLNRYGYNETESILNEWQYVKGWSGDEFQYTVNQIMSNKGAAFVMACMSECQRTPVDMLMYYDARPSVFNGMFDFYSYKPLKGYYPFLWFGMLYENYKEVECKNNIDDVYTICGVNGKEKVMSVITYYSDLDIAQDKSVAVDFGKDENTLYEIYLMDEDNTGDFLYITKSLEFTLKPNSCVMIKEV